MTGRYCSSCCRSIFDLPTYARLCKPCYVESKKREQIELQTEVETLRAENARLLARSVQVVPMVEPSMLRRLLQLCHPDKHNGSTLAGEVTTWLLTLRRSAQ